MYRRSLGIMILTGLMVACTHVSQEVPHPHPPTSVTSTQAHNDVASYRQAVDFLRAGDYVQAKTLLRDFATKFPKSSYLPYVDIYMKMLDEMDTLRAQVTRCQRDTVKLQRELRDTKTSLDKTLAEKQQLARELEALEQDLEYLKTVEVELQKRIKSLR